MMAGRLKYFLELLRPARSVDEYGSEAVSWLRAGHCRAERVKRSGGRSEETQERFADVRVEWNVRIQHKVLEGWRVRERGGYLYEVAAVVPNRDRGYVTLVTERVNE